MHQQIILYVDHVRNHEKQLTDSQTNPIPPMNKALPESDSPSLTTESNVVSELEQRLRQSLELRVCNVPAAAQNNQDAKIAVLFSGGLDCTLLARLSHELLPSTQPIDLLNVAFENPRVAAAATSTANKEKKPLASTSVYESCPDRITGRAALAELQKVCPGRQWRLVAIDVPYAETISHRELIKRLMRPHNTEMDLSIACALYFASRGRGAAYKNQTGSSSSNYYTTPARVLLSGLGADELFAGYGRHGIAFQKHNFKGLIDEITLDVSRLGKRNLGRDDRILCHWGREARYPFLDEDFVAWVLRIPVWEKCGFGLPGDEDEPSSSSSSSSSQRGIDPEKKALRLVALRLGMGHVAREKKRAIQFGSRTAKMERGRTRGTDALG